MARGITIADLVQQVFYAQYKVRLDVTSDIEGAFHSKSDKFKEVVMEANFVLNEFQTLQDWNALRAHWVMGKTERPDAHSGIQEIQLPSDAYKVCKGYGDSVILADPITNHPLERILFAEARYGNSEDIEMYSEWGSANAPNNAQLAFQVGDILTFRRPWLPSELGLDMECDVIKRIEPLHICDNSCPDNCPKAYQERVLTWLNDPYYMVVRTAARRALADPACADMVQTLTDEGTKMLSQLRNIDGQHNMTETWATSTPGYISVY